MYIKQSSAKIIKIKNKYILFTLKLTFWFYNCNFCWMIIVCHIYMLKAGYIIKNKLYINWLYLQSPMVQYAVTKATDMRGMTVSPAKLAL